MGSVVEEHSNCHPTEVPVVAPKRQVYLNWHCVLAQVLFLSAAQLIGPPLQQPSWDAVIHRIGHLYQGVLLSQLMMHRLCFRRNN